MVLSSFRSCFLWIIFTTLTLTSQGHASTDSPWSFEFGPRYWLSSEKFQYDLFGFSNSMVSRLTFSNMTSNAAEGFWQLSHDNGVFLKGYFGGGSINGGKLIDEDFPPAIMPYSRTYSKQKDGALNYLSVDLGYNFLTRENWHLGGFLGYHHRAEIYNTFGCVQLASNPNVCASVPPNDVIIPTSLNALNEDVIWNSLRLGINASIQLINKLNAMIDLAYIRSNLGANDFHNGRPDIRGVFINSAGNGVQLDAILNWELSQALTVGIGGRWWYTSMTGFDRFEQTVFSGQPQMVQIKQNSYGLLLQTNYKFNDTPILSATLSKEKERVDSPIFYWPGLYLGANLGYGTNPADAYFIAQSSTALLFQNKGYTAKGLNIQDAGFLGGGQIGYNWQMNSIILGVDADLDYANISSANAATSSDTITTTINKNIQWLATIRGRLGKLASDSMLVYLTTGPAFGSAIINFDQRVAGSPCPTSWCVVANKTQTKVGWTGGAGLEYAVSKGISFKAEYLYVYLGNIATNAAGNSILGAVNYNIKSSFNNNVVRLGVNYKI